MSGLWEARGTAHLQLVEHGAPKPFAALGMPCDIELEQNVLGAILVSDRVLPALAGDDRLTVDCFYRGWHREVYRAMLNLSARDEPVDVVTVTNALTDQGIPRGQVAVKLEELVGYVAHIGNTRTYARRLVELAGWRTVKHAGIELAAAADNLDVERRDNAEGLLGRPQRHSSTMDGTQLANMIFDHLAGGDVIKALEIPFFGLMQYLGGLRPGETTLLGGWTGHGKSVCADAILTHLGREGRRVHLYINEMTSRVRSLRILSAEAGVPLSRLLNRMTMTDKDGDAATRVLKQGMPFGITDAAGWSAHDISRDIRLHGWDVACVDILHLIEHKETKDLDAISQALTLAAKTSGCHLIATVHLNEERAKTGRLPVPVLRDIRQSGMLKNNADNVLFIHREDEANEHGVVSMLDTGSLSVAKCRNGALGSVGMVFDGRHVRYREVGR